MRHLILSLMLFASLDCFSQDVYPAPRFCFKVITPPSFLFNFHRPRKDCKSGLGICLRYSLGEYGLVPCNKAQEVKDEVKLEKETVHYALYLFENEALLLLPSEITETAEFEKEDMHFFHVDDELLVFGDAGTGKAYRLKQGSYPVEQRDGRLEIRISTEPAGMESLR